MNHINRYISIICFCLLPFYIFAQIVVIQKDSVLREKRNMRMETPTSVDVDGAEIIRMETLKQCISGAKIFLFSTPASTDIFAPFTPYYYSGRNFVEGFTLQGIQKRFMINDFLSANLNIYFSSQYDGMFQPDPYVNAHARLDFILKLHDRVQVVGMGQISVREGLDPKIPSSIGNANYYGLGLQFKVTKKVGVGFGATNSFYRGSWTKQTYVSPVCY